MDEKQDIQHLIHQAQGGNRDAFDRLVRRYSPRLEVVVRRRIGSSLRQRIEIADVLQESLLKAFQSIGSFEYRGEESFLQWLKAIAENLLLYWAREYQRRDQLPLLSEPKGTAVSPSRELRRQERFSRLQEVFSQLNPDEREVILAARVEGLPMKEIAKRLGRSPDAARPLLWRSIQKLRVSFRETESLSLPRRTLLEEDESNE
jgi:RNA polymerase sigma-70 factor (ECF subfamily)